MCQFGFSQKKTVHLHASWQGARQREHIASLFVSKKKSHTVNLVSSTQPLQISVVKVHSLVESLSDRLVGVAGPLDKTMIGVVINQSPLHPQTNWDIKVCPESAKSCIVFDKTEKICPRPCLERAPYSSCSAPGQNFQQKRPHRVEVEVADHRRASNSVCRAVFSF